MFCRQCGNELNPEAQFCKSCGAVSGRAPSTVAGEPPGNAAAAFPANAVFATATAQAEPSVQAGKRVAIQSIPGGIGLLVIFILVSAFLLSRHRVPPSSEAEIAKPIQPSLAAEPVSQRTCQLSRTAANRANHSGPRPNRNSSTAGRTVLIRIGHGSTISFQQPGSFGLAGCRGDERLSS